LNLASSQIPRWATVLGIATGWIILLTISQTSTETLLAIVGLGSLGLLLIVLIFGGGEPSIQWNEEIGVMLSHKRWVTEISAASIFTSVPLSIDVSHAGSRVLRAMSTRMKDKRGGEVRFFVCRPLEIGPTTVGYTVVRRTPRHLLTARRLRKMADTVFADNSILESAMRAAYPHTPIRRANRHELAGLSYGGIGVIA
jgi:hypothetical protein